MPRTIPDKGNTKKAQGKYRIPSGGVKHNPMGPQENNAQAQKNNCRQGVHKKPTTGKNMASRSLVNIFWSK
jgi:hypothetical protein